MYTRVTRHFATVDGQWGRRQVHYRRAGDGPPVLLLHQSPQSSHEYLPLMQDWARNFTLIAPDTPGYGLSDPLRADHTGMENFATAVIEFGDALGLDRFAVYGFHTGGTMGVALAHEYPQRISAVATNGLVLLNQSERQEIVAHYLPHFAPSWDGSHLTWLWARLREQTVFFPWFKRTRESRMDFTMHGTDQLQNNLREFLRAGDHYRDAYGAAFTYDAGPVLSQLEVPVFITAAAADPLSAHLDRVGDRADCVQIARSANHAEALDRALQHLLAYPGETCPAAPQAGPAAASQPWNDFINTDRGGIRLRRREDAEGEPTLLIHGAGGSSETVAEFLEALAARGPAIAMDLPGHGESDDAAPANESRPDRCVQAILDTIDGLNLPSCELVGYDSGCMLAIEAVRRAPERFRALTLIDPPLLSAAQRDAWRREGTPSLAPEWHGGHLLRAWHMVRDARLFYPWFQRDREGIRWIEPSLDENSLNVEARDLLASEGVWQQLVADYLNYPLQQSLEDLGVAARLCATAASPCKGALAALAENGPHLKFVSLPSDIREWSQTLPAAR